MKEISGKVNRKQLLQSVEEGPWPEAYDCNRMRVLGGVDSKYNKCDWSSDRQLNSDYSFFSSTNKNID